MRGLSAYQRQTLIVGCVAAFGFPIVVMAFFIPLSGWLIALGSVLFGGLILWTPFLGLAFIAGEARSRVVRYGGLAVLVALSVFTWWVASSDAQGGIVALYTVPAQWLVAMLTGLAPSGKGSKDTTRRRL